MFKRHTDFRNKILIEIRWWAWAAAILPISSLSALFFIWAYGTERVYNLAMIIGSSSMFVIAVVWWWWALHAIKTLVNHWDETRENVKTVITDVREVRGIIQELFRTNSDK